MALSVGRQGMTKAMKKAARLSSMVANRKRDKKSQRAAYHSEFRNAPGPSPIERSVCGCITIPPAEWEKVRLEERKHMSRR